MKDPELNAANDTQKRLERLREYNRSLTDENMVLHKGMELLQEEVNRLTKLLERVLMK